MEWYMLMSPRLLLQLILVFTTLLFVVGAWIARRAQRTVTRPSFNSMLTGVYVGLTALVVIRAVTLVTYPNDPNDDPAMIPLAATTAAALTLLLALNWVAVRAMESAKAKLKGADLDMAEEVSEATQLLNDIDTQLIDRVLRGDIPSKARIEEFKQRHETLTQAYSARA